jgi:hypothetical protein
MVMRHDTQREQIEQLLRSYRLHYTLDHDGDNLPLVDLLSGDGPTIDRGEDEIQLLADDLVTLLHPHTGGEDDPWSGPGAECAKCGDFIPEGWIHGCG